eukprot:FR742834.1.p4 GENE.FR742834.1~~FR742834.1.p4  ORF type:complete len:104 (+),score=68.60 FR742834.1:861-1172(+)
MEFAQWGGRGGFSVLGSFFPLPPFTEPPGGLGVSGGGGGGFSLPPKRGGKNRFSHKILGGKKAGEKKTWGKQKKAKAKRGPGKTLFKKRGRPPFPCRCFFFSP